MERKEYCEKQCGNTEIKVLVDTPTDREFIEVCKVCNMVLEHHVEKKPKEEV